MDQAAARPSSRPERVCDSGRFRRSNLKLFVRKDLFRRIISGGFVNLTHVNARKIEIGWDEDDLFDLLVRPMRESSSFVQHLGTPERASSREIFYGTFPPQVDPGKRKPATWIWMIRRIRDGNGVKPPRNLIDLVQKAQQEQHRREEREKNEHNIGQPLIGSDALKRGLSRLSNERVEDTLLAEAGDHAHLIERFRDGKAEHNEVTVAEVLEAEGQALTDAMRVLMDLGFLEQVGATYKIPMLYRDGLRITQGKAFVSGEAPEEEE